MHWDVLLTNLLEVEIYARFVWMVGSDIEMHLNWTWTLYSLADNDESIS